MMEYDFDDNGILVLPQRPFRGDGEFVSTARMVYLDALIEARGNSKKQAEDKLFEILKLVKEECDYHLTRKKWL